MEEGYLRRAVFHGPVLLEAYLPVAIFTLLALLFSAGTFLATRWFRPTNPTPLKDLTYECGEVPEGEGAIQFHFQYYMFAIIFVVFDVAAVFLLLWALAFSDLLTNTAVSAVAKFSILGFIAILFIATNYALKKEEVIHI